MDVKTCKTKELFAIKSPKTSTFAKTLNYEKKNFTIYMCPDMLYAYHHVGTNKRKNYLACQSI